jgi:hypothetical protein
MLSDECDATAMIPKLVTGQEMKIQTGVDPDGSGLKHQTVLTGTIAGSGMVTVALTWTTQFADPNCEAVCNVEDVTGSLQVVGTQLTTATEVSVAVKNNDPSNSHSGSLNCFGIHD